MPRPIRFKPPALYHVFNRGVAKQPIVWTDIDRLFFCKMLGSSLYENNVRLYAFCVMDNHFHLLLETLSDNLDRFIWRLASYYVRQFNFHHDRVGPLFQSRYKHKMVSKESYLLQVFRYIHLNPVKAGLVAKIEDYRWSSYPCYMGNAPTWNGLNTDWFLKQFHQDPLHARECLKKFHGEADTIDPDNLNNGAWPYFVRAGRPKAVNR